MQNKKEQTSPVAAFFARLVNVAPHEFPRVALAFGVKLCFQIGFTIGWTMLTAMLVNRAGIEYLPLLFVANAALIIFGTIIFSEIVHRFSRKIVIFGAIASGAALLITAAALFTTTGSLKPFFVLALLAESFFFAQLNILLGLFIEDLFSPLEGQRAFPLVESSEYIGGIVGGLLILFAIDVLHFDAPNLIFFWATAIVLILPILAYFYSRKKLPSLQISKPKSNKLSKLSKIREGSLHIRKTPFLLGLVFVVMLQWSFFTLLSFQYTKAVDANVSHGETIGGTPTHASGENTAHHEDLLTHGLSVLHIAFSLLALLTQLFVSSRVIERLGIVRTLAVHPLVTTATTLGLTFQFGFGSAIASKGLFEATTGIFNAAYHSSFYALRESVREHAKAFLEGLVRPLGVILGTGGLFALQYFFHGELLTSAINLVMLGAVLTMGGVIFWLRERYTHVSKKNLELLGDHPAKFSSIEVLSQQGHSNAAEILVKNLLYKKESELMKVKILKTLGRIRDPQTIPEILTCFDDPSPAIKLAAVRALGEFTGLGEHFFTQAFTRHRVISALKELFEKENDKELRSAIVHVFANMHQAEVVPFLLDTLEETDLAVKADSIYVCGMFHDISAAHYLERFLKDSDPHIRSNAIIALWQFPQYRLRLTILLTTLIEADDRVTQKAAIHTLGEIGALQEKPRLLRYLEHEDPELQLLAALALAKLDHEEAPARIAEFVLHENKELAELARKHLCHTPREIQKNVQEIVHQKLSARLTDLLADAGVESLLELSPAVLSEMRELYTTAGDWEEVAKIDAAAAGRELD